MSTYPTSVTMYQKSDFDVNFVGQGRSDKLKEILIGKAFTVSFAKTKENKYFEGNITVTTFNCEVEIVFSRRQQSRFQGGNYFLFSTAFIVGSFGVSLLVAR